MSGSNRDSPNQPTPVVFMIHGTTGTGEKMFNISGWAPKAEAKGFLAVFPTALAYPIVEVGCMQTKWNSHALIDLVVPGTPLADDVGFVRRIVEMLHENFNVDERRIFASANSK